MVGANLVSLSECVSNVPELEEERTGSESCDVGKETDAGGIEATSTTPDVANPTWKDVL